MMADWQKWKELTGAEKRILLQAALLVRLVSFGLRLISMRRMQSTLGWMSGHGNPTTKGRKDPITADQIARLVRIAASRGPARPNCLPRALILWTLLRRQGCDAGIRFGTRKSNDTIEAHAWVEIEGRDVNDDGNVSNMYSPFEPPLVCGQEKLP